MSSTVIGDFRTTSSNAARTAVSPAADTQEQPAETVEATAPEPTLAPDKRTVGEDDDWASLSPAERYRRRLERAGISLTQAEGIFDAVLMKGYYEEYVRIRSQRAVFRTRKYDDQLRLQTALEVGQHRLAITQEELIARYNLAASLYEWQGKPIPHNTDEDFTKALKMIENMPIPLVTLLVGALSKFDAKIMAVFSEGAADSF